MSPTTQHRYRETAAAYEAMSALREALVGNAALAWRGVNDALAVSQGKDVVAFAAIAEGLAGDASQAGHTANDLNQCFPDDTSVQFNILPGICAAATLPDGGAQPG